jgi:two-component system LytT family response regulator
MAEIRALVVDDEPLARRGIRQLLGRHPDITVLGECRNGREAIRASESANYDLMFLDVQMPGLGGFDVVRRWHGGLPVTVFVTAYQEFAVRAFESCALDYLVKPVSQVRFDAAMLRVRERIRQGQAEALAARLATLLQSQEEETSREQQAVPRSLLVPTSTGKVALDPTEIDWIEARDYYSCIHAGDQRYLVRESMRSLERQLDRRFFVRVHRGAIVRLATVRELRTGPSGAILVLKEGTRIPVSRRRREQLNRSLLKSYHSL